MKKIMFNDRYGLTKAVLDGRKTMTRRIIPPIEIDWNRRGKVTLPVSCFRDGILFMDASAILEQDFEYTAPAKYQPKYNAGEVVAVAQSYHTLNKSGYVAPEWLDHTCEDSAGYKNKMFVRADLMPHMIRITNIRMEHLQDITDDDCLREGVFLGQFHTYSYVHRPRCPFNTPRSAFASLIDKISGKGTWEKNPWVYVYELELLK